LSYSFIIDYIFTFQLRRFGTVAVSVEAVPKMPTLRVRKSAVCDAFNNRIFGTFINPSTVKFRIIITNIFTFHPPAKLYPPLQQMLE
ncbi:hypothetical protein, partial [Galactobacillus timonensis]|uniref:hypothetical protein n=1 Tax=Galactobacillus timonensis TaxID=2041840 RepID=UPI001AEBC514